MKQSRFPAVTELFKPLFLAVLFCLGSIPYLRNLILVNMFKMLEESEFNTLGSTNDLEKQLQDFFIEVKAMIKMGKEEDAVDLLQENYEAVKAQFDSGDQSIEEVALLDVIALKYMALEDLRTVGSMMNLEVTIHYFAHHLWEWQKLWVLMKESLMQ